MRLSHVTSPVKTGHLFPSTKMSLLKNSNEKLNDIGIIAEDCKELPVLLMSKAQILVKQLFEQTEDHRRRLVFHLQKNWLRLMLSMIVLIVQFTWFTVSFPVDLNSPIEYNTMTIAPCNSDSLASSISFSSESHLTMSERHYMLDYLSNDSTNHSIDDHENEQKEDQCINESNRTTTTTTMWTTLTWIMAIMWKLFLLIKLALIMLCFELIRLSDTVVNVIRQINDEEDERLRSPPKSPVDTGYIERNRGYK
ncbi:hypothetical protein BLOT_010702 [Blomia tropicalis]|nr:hypothetical protein BLOT_010702 [Blomia tropicalis]